MTDINNCKYYHMHKIRYNATIKRRYLQHTLNTNDNKVHELYQNHNNMYNNHTLTRSAELCAIPRRNHKDHRVYRHRPASDLSRSRPHPSHSPFQLLPLAPLAYHPVILSRQTAPTSQSGLGTQTCRNLIPVGHLPLHPLISK